MRAWVVLPLLLVAGAAFAQQGQGQGQGRGGQGQNQGPPAEILFNGQDLTGWKLMVGNRADSWQVREVNFAPAMVCVGGRSGGDTLSTIKKYTNFRFQVEYNWVGGAGGNGGVFLRIDPVVTPERTWNRNYQIQVHGPEEGPSGTGDIWITGWDHGTAQSARPAPPAPPRAAGAPTRGGRAPVVMPPGVAPSRTFLRFRRDMDRQPGQWNSYDITLNNGELVVLLNGQEVNRLTGVPSGVTAGIGFECGSPALAFRNVRVTPLP